MAEQTKKIIDSFNELQTLECLQELCEHIERNNWQYLFEKVNDSPIIILRNEIEELKYSKEELKYSKEEFITNFKNYLNL